MSNSEADGGRGQSTEEMLAMRLNVINELIATERDFVRDLSTILEHIMKPLEDRSSPYAKMFTAADISTLFSNIAMIEVMCKDLLSKFEQAASEAPRPADAAVGKAIIAKKIALTASFSAYCANQSQALHLIDTLKKKGSFNAYLQSVRDHPNLRGLGLMDWLIKPVQRVTKYPLLLRELERYTPENHSDRENTCLAAKAVQELVDQVNAAAKTTESYHHMMRIADEVGDIPSSLRLKTTPGRYYVTEGKFIKVSHGKHQERFFWLFSDLVMYARLNVAPLKKYTYKGTIILSKSNYEDLPDGNEFGANAIRITRLDSKKTYIIYCKDPKQKVFWLTNINELKELTSKGTLAPSMPTIGVAKIVSDAETPADFPTKASAAAETEKKNNSLVMWSVAVRIAGWHNEDQDRGLLHECAVRCKPFGKDVDYCFMFTDGWMGTKIKLFKTAQSSKNAVDFKVFVPFELMESFQTRSDTSVEVRYIDPDGGSKNGSFIIEYETPELQREALKLLPVDQIGKVRESQYTKRISRQSVSDPMGTSGGAPGSQPLMRSQTTHSLTFSSPNLPSPGKPIPANNNRGPPVPAGYKKSSFDTGHEFGTSTFSGPTNLASSPVDGSYFSSTYSGPLTQSSPMSTPHMPLTNGNANASSPPIGTLSSSAPPVSFVDTRQSAPPASARPKEAPLPNNSPGARASAPRPAISSPGIVSRTNSPKTAVSPPMTQHSPSDTNGKGPPPMPVTVANPAAADSPGTSSPTAKFTGVAPKKGPGPPIPKTPVTNPNASPANASSPSFASTPKQSPSGYGSAPSSMPAKSVHSGAYAKGSPKGPPAKITGSPFASDDSSMPKTYSTGGSIKAPPKTPLTTQNAPVAGTLSASPKLASEAPPMPSVPKFNSTAAAKKGGPPGAAKVPGKLASAAKKWPP